MHEVELSGTKGPIRPEIVPIFEDDRFAFSRQFGHVDLMTQVKSSKCATKP
jgi:hypothetical protein